MKIETQPRDDHQVKVTAEFEPAALEKYKKIAARQIAQKAKIPGFRPGKAPYDVIVRLYGEQTIEDDAVEYMIEDVYPSILKEANINPGAPGTLDEIISREPMKLSFIIPLEPTVELGEYREVRKEYALEPVTEKQVNDFLKRLGKSYATAEPVDRPAQKDDLVYLKADATIVNPAEGDKPELLKDSPLQVVIGENDPIENDFPFVGFGDNLIGLSANEEKTFKYTYPEDSKFDRLRGKEVEFHVTIQNVKSLKLPEMNDEFAQSMGMFENMDKLREAVKEQLAAQNKSEYEQGYFDDLIDKLLAKATIKYPPQLLEEEVEHVVDSIKQDLAQQKMELDVYLKSLKKEKEKWLEEEIKPVAKKRLERSLLLDEIARVEKIEVGKEELSGEFNNMVAEMQSQQDFKKLTRKMTNEKLANAIAMQAATKLLNQHVLERVKEIATGKYEEKTAETESSEKPEVEAKPKRAAKKKVAEEAAVEEQPAETPKPKRSTKKSAE